MAALPYSYRVLVLNRLIKGGFAEVKFKQKTERGEEDSKVTSGVRAVQRGHPMQKQECA